MNGECKDVHCPCHDFEKVNGRWCLKATDVQEGNNKKPTNPKDSVGIAKVPLSTVPGPVIMEIGLSMMEGALKYGRHNYRDAGVLASVYFDAFMRHAWDWWEGRDVDPDSGFHNLTKAMACLTVIRDSQIRNNWVDDRPPRVESGWVEHLNALAKSLLDKYPEPVKAHTQVKRASEL